MLNTNKIFLISGLYGSGKSSVAKNIYDYYSYYQQKVTIVPFAEELKNTAREKFGWDGKKDERGRKLLQNVGRIGRQYNENIWVEKVTDKIFRTLPNNPEVLETNHVFINDDWRFPNEFEYLKRYVEIHNTVNASKFEIITIRVVRDIERDPEFLNDVSESSLNDSMPYDIVIYNNFENEYLLKSKILELLKK